MSDEATRRSRGVRALGELVMIIVGVLVALAANAWWEGRQDQARSRLYLETLQADLRATDSLIAVSITRDQQSAAESSQIAAVLVAGQSWKELPDAVKPHFGIDDVWFRTGTVSALLATGDINNIPSETLRSGIVRYEDEVEVIRNSLDRMSAAAWSNVQDYIHVEQELIASSNDASRRRRALSMSTTELLRSFPLEQIRRYPEIAATFRLHAIVMGNRIEALRMARSSVQDLRHLVSEELGGGQ